MPNSSQIIRDVSLTSNSRNKASLLIYGLDFINKNKKVYPNVTAQNSSTMMQNDGMVLEEQSEKEWANAATPSQRILFK